MAKQLVMKFSTDEGKSVSLKIPNINDTTVTTDAVKTLGADIIAKDVFLPSGGHLKKLTAAHVSETTSTDLLA